MSLQYLQTALQNAEIKAMLQTIRKSEGTAGPEGYNFLFGSNDHNTIRFTDMSKHPNIHRPFGNTTSSAAGAYQIMHDTDAGLTSQLIKMGMPEDQAESFTPEMQDLKCVLLFSNHNTCEMIKQGHFESAISVLNKTWASLPGSPYGQPVHTLADVSNWYKEQGGTIA